MYRKSLSQWGETALKLVLLNLSLRKQEESAPRAIFSSAPSFCLVFPFLLLPACHSAMAVSSSTPTDPALPLLSVLSSSSPMLRSKTNMMKSYLATRKQYNSVDIILRLPAISQCN